MVSLRREFECGRKEGRFGKGIADWQLLIARPLGMAPRELLVDTETMRDDIKQWGEKARTQTGGTVALPGRHSWESLCCARIYIVKFSIYLQSRLRVHKTEKRGDSEYPRAEWSRAGGPVASTYRAGRRACRVAARWVVSGHSRPNVHWHLTSSISPHILRCRPHGFI